ncbi:LysR family transcriptional regulator [Acinetobacter baumannii]|nr:LysR family transcriptional regulator [Acinetobacter baumannii]ELS5859758.1 LysR family transcriptional regulator [Acinetobacter baumannii]
MIDWENLHYFSVFSEEKTLSAAARKLGVDHATVARRIAQLEDNLKLKLVDRRPRTYILTSEGERLAKIVTRMMEETFSIERLAQAGQQEISGVVSVSLPPATAAHLVMPHLGKFYRQYPELQLGILGDVHYASLQHREADIAVRFGRPKDDYLIARKAGEVPFGIYAAQEYLDAIQEENYGWISVEVGGVQGQKQQKLKQRLNYKEPVMVTNHPELQWRATCGAVGLAVLPDFLGQQGHLVKLPDDDPMSAEIWLVIHEDLRSSPAVRVVMDFLLDCFEPFRV